MALRDLANPETILPSQIVLGTSFLLALRPLDDNPYAATAQAFARRLRPRVQALELVVSLIRKPCFSSNCLRPWRVQRR